MNVLLYKEQVVKGDINNNTDGVNNNVNNNVNNIGTPITFHRNKL